MQKRIKIGQDPGAESEREVEFQRNKQVMVDVKRVINQCRDGNKHEEIPSLTHYFITMTAKTR